MNPVNDAITIDSLSVTYRTRSRELRAVADVSLVIGEGQTVALLGPNGSGKSTLLKAICGMVRAQAGHVLLASHSPESARQLLGVVFQSTSLDRHMSVEENLRDYAALYGLNGEAARSSVEEALTQAGLRERRRSLVKTLSGGLARRLDLARALMHRPRIVLLDEPTVGLDPSARAAFLASIEEWQRARNLTIVMSTHLIDEADRMSRVVLMSQGRIVADDAPEYLRRSVGARLVTVEDHEWAPFDAHWKRSHIGWRLSLENDGERAGPIASQLAAAGVSFSIAPPTLADAFEHYTGRSLDQSEKEAGHD